MHDAVREALRTLLAAPKEAFEVSPGEAAEAAVDWQRLAERVAAARAVAVAEAEATGSWRESGAASPQAWARHALGLSSGQAAELVRTARALRRDLPATATALFTGRIGWSHATLLARHALVTPVRRAAVAEPGGEEALVAAAEVATVEQLSRVLRGWAHAIDSETAAADEATLDEQRRVSLAQTLGDGWALEGWLPPEAGAILATVLDAHVGSMLGVADGRTVPQLRADALTDLARHAAEVGAVPHAGGLRPQLLVHVPVETLAGVEGAPPAELGHGGGLLSPTALSVLACDSALVRLVLDADGRPLDVGRTRRSVPVHLRHAVFGRDRHCVFPGCDRPATWCDAHHVTYWREGGPTSVDNLVLLCRHHHTRVHQLAVRISRGRTHWAFTLPDGRLLGRSTERLRLPLPLPGRRRRRARWAA